MKKLVDKMRRRCKGSKIIKHRFESYFIRIFNFLFANWFHLKCESFIFLHVSLVQSQPLRMMRIIHSILGISKYSQVHRNSTKISTKIVLAKRKHTPSYDLVGPLVICHIINFSTTVDSRIFDGKFLLKFKIYNVSISYELNMLDWLQKSFEAYFWTVFTNG